MTEICQTQQTISQIRHQLEDIERAHRHNNPAEALRLAQKLNELSYRLSFELSQNQPKVSDRHDPTR